jgi:hypothetical protein
MRGQISVWWIPACLLYGAIITMITVARGRKEKKRHLEVEAIYLEIINKQIAEISSLKFYAAFRKNMGKKDIERGGPKL